MNDSNRNTHKHEVLKTFLRTCTNRRDTHALCAPARDREERTVVSDPLLDHAGSH